MQPPTTPKEKVTVYFDTLERQFLCPMRNEAVASSCVASLLLMFAAIDSMGRLIYSDYSARNGKRFKAFLARLGGQYAVEAEALWRLRNSLVHEAINVAAYMSAIAIAEPHHLQKGRAGDIFIATRRFYEDLARAEAELKRETLGDDRLTEEADAKLEARPYQVQDYWGVETTPPASVVYATGLKRRQSDVDKCASNDT